MKKVYGITNPKKIDYMFSILIAFVAITALWVGIWIASTNSYESAELSFGLFEKAITFNLSETNYWLVLAQSVVLYGGFASALALLILTLVRKKFRAVLGAFAVAFAGPAIALEMGFVGIYANQAESQVVGVFAIVLAICCVATGVFAYKIAKFTCKLAIFDKLYDYEFENYFKGLLKERKREVTALSKSEKVYDAVNEQKTEENKNKKAEPKKEKPAKKVVEPKVEEEQEDSVFGIKSNHYTFEQKLKMAKPVARKYFKEIKDYYEELGFKSALTKSGETFSYKNTKFAVITTAGKSGLKVYLKLSPANYTDSTLPFKDVSDKKKYEKTPLLFVVKSDLAVRRAKALMDDIKKELENEQKK